MSTRQIFCDELTKLSLSNKITKMSVILVARSPYKTNYLSENSAKVGVINKYIFAYENAHTSVYTNNKDINNVYKTYYLGVVLKQVYYLNVFLKA